MATDAHDGEKGQLRLGPARLGVEELAPSRLLTRLVKALLKPGSVIVMLAEVRKFGLWLMSTIPIFTCDEVRVRRSTDDIRPSDILEIVAVEA